MKRFLFVIVLLLLLWIPLAAAARPAGCVLPEDFAARGVALGEAVDEARLVEAFGPVLFNNEKSVFGFRVKYYNFKKKFVVGVVPATGRVVDIVIEDRDYAARDGLRYGATPHRIKEVYGSKERTRIGGLTWYVFTDPENPHKRLMMESEPGTWILVSWRLTSLPLTEEEAELWDGPEEDWQNADLAAHLMNEKEIDMSALKSRDEPQKERTPPWKR
ncbi:MAG: hypothetical protein IJU05_06855 [Schwartzia sp.]|nr:hypothetical protein [Schwartzia sp. (in: firmicutes)]